MAFLGDAIRICKLVTLTNLPPCSTAEETRKIISQRMGKPELRQHCCSLSTPAFPQPCSQCHLYPFVSFRSSLLHRFKLNPLFPHSSSPLCPLNPCIYTSLHRSVLTWNIVFLSLLSPNSTGQGLLVTLSRSLALPSFQRWWTSRQHSLSALLLPPLTSSSLT